MNALFKTGCFFLTATMCVSLPCFASVTVTGTPASGSSVSDTREFSFSVTVPADAQLAVVGVTNEDDRGTEWVRFGGHPNMTFVVDSVGSGMWERVQLFYHKNPPAGAQTITVRLTNNSRHKAAGCLFVRGVKMEAFSSPGAPSPLLPLSKVSGGGSGTALLSFTGAEAPTGSLVFGAINTRTDDLTIQGAEHVQRWNINTRTGIWPFYNYSRHGGSTMVGSSANGVSMPWQVTDNWGMAGFVIPAQYSGMLSMSPDSLQVNDGDPGDTLLGTLSAVDGDGQGPYTWTLADSAGGRFKLSAATTPTPSVNVRIDNAALIDHGQNAMHTITVRVRNAVHPVDYEKAIAVHVRDTTLPVIGAITCSRMYARDGELAYFSATVSDNSGLPSDPVMTLNGVPLVLFGKTGNDYTWAWTAGGVGDGPVTVHLSAQDAAGNQHTAVGQHLLIVDNTSPVLTDFSVSRANARPGDVIHAGITATDANGIQSFPVLLVSGVNAGVPVVEGNRYTWAYALPPDTPDGPVTLHITAWDLPGNDTQGVTADLLTVDGTLPVVSTFTSSHYFARTGDTVQLSAAVTDNFGLAFTPTMRVNGNLLNAPQVLGMTYTWTLAVSSLETQGPASIVVEAEDFAGNVRTESPATTILIIDRTLPSITQLQVIPGLARPGTQITLSAQVLDNYGLAAPPVMTVNGFTPAPPSQSGHVYTWTHVVPSSPPEGPATIQVQATDFAGNIRTVTSTTHLSLDPNGPAFSQVQANPNLRRHTQTTTISVRVTDFSGLSGTPTLHVNGQSATHTGASGGVHTFTFTVGSATPEGDAALVFSGTDVLGNQSSQTFAGVLTIDRSPPAVTDLAANPSTARQGVVVRITFNAYDTFTSVVSNPSVSVNGGSAQFHSRNGNLYEYRYTVRAPHLDPDGAANVIIVARDTAGNIATRNVNTVLGIDNSVPAISALTVFPGFVRDGQEVVIGFQVVDASGLGGHPLVTVNGNPAVFRASEGPHYEYRYTSHRALDDDGPAAIAVTVTDTVGNVGSSTSSGLLTVDHTPPTGTVTINGGTLFTRITDVTLAVDAQDGAIGSGVEAMSISDDGAAWSAWQPFADNLPWQLKPGQGYKHIYARFRDRAGNVSSIIIRDVIALNPYPLIVEREGPEKVDSAPGSSVVLEVTPRNVFGRVVSYEWKKDGKVIGADGGGVKTNSPVLALDQVSDEDEGVYICTVSDELETADSPPFVLTVTEALPVSTALPLILCALILPLLGVRRIKKNHRRPIAMLLAAVACWVACMGMNAHAETTVVYSARAQHPDNLSDDALIDLARERGSIELWTRKPDGTVRRELSRLGDPGIANPGFTSLQREEMQAWRDKGHAVTLMKDGGEQLVVDLSASVKAVYQTPKSVSGPSFEMILLVNDEVLLMERRYEEEVDGQVRPVLIRVDYQGGALIQVFEYTTTPPPPLPPVYLRKTGVDESLHADEYPKSYIIKSEGDTQTRESQFIVPPQGLDTLGFDSGWVPGGTGPDPGGFIIQVRLNAAGGYNYDASVYGDFHLGTDSLLHLGNASGNWGFYFGAEFFFKAAFDIPPIFGFDLDPFVVDIPYVPEFNMVASDRDNFNSWLLDSVSTVRDEAGRINVVNVDIVSLLISGGVLPSLPSWVPLPSVGAKLDVGAVANGTMTCDNIALSDGTVFTTEGQALPIFVPENGYQAVASYNENASLNLGVKFYPGVYFSWFGFRWDWPVEGDDNILTRLEWLPIAHTNFPFTSAELNFTGQPSTAPATDWFTQHFNLGDNNVDFLQARFTPNQSNNFYVACINPASGFRTNPAGGTVVTLGDNEFAQVNLTHGKQVSLYGRRYSSFYISSNGYITFDQGDANADVSLENHFNQPRISALLSDFKPNEGGTISWKQLPNRVVVTFDRMHISRIIVEQTASFQVEMFFDGRIVITWLQVDTYGGLVGLSRGGGVPEGYVKSRFTLYPVCMSGIPDEAGVRVTFSPPEALPYNPRWRLGSGAWMPGDTYASAPLGGHIIHFNHIPLYWQPPAPVNVNLTVPDSFVDLNATWTRLRGTVTVSTSPVPASWTIVDADGQTHAGTGAAVLENMPTGMTTISWQHLPTYSLPAQATQQAMLYSGMTVAFTGMYAPIIGEGQATLIINLDPPLLVAAGGQWRVGGGQWNNSGVSVTIPDGDNTIEFKDVPGWTRPAALTLFFHRNTTTELIRAYARHRGTIIIDTDPNGAPWSMVDGDGVTRTGAGDQVLTQVPTGAQVVTWGGIPGFHEPTPNPFAFTLDQGQTRRVIGAYMPIIGEGEGILRVTILPPSAVYAGAQWRLLGGEWRSSGGMAPVPDGERTVIFRDLPGWITPPEMTVNVQRDRINDFSATYVRQTGTVVMEVNPPHGHWTLTDADGNIHSSMGPALLENMPSGPVSVLWTEIPGHAAPAPNPSVHALEPGATITIRGEYVEAILTADFTAFPLTGTPPLTVNFQDRSHSTTKAITAWRWYFGDGRVSNDQHPSHAYRTPGTYTVTLSVSTPDQVDIVSKKHFITISKGLPTAGTVGMVMLAALCALAGCRRIRRRAS